MPIVSVPVLSEQRTDMQPRVSMVARFLTRTLRRAMRLAMMVRERATQSGRPCMACQYAINDSERRKQT